jgi:hypothetical protein
MKKILLIGLIGLMGLIDNQAQAQFGDYGVKIGLGHATIDDDLTTKSGILGASIGGYINYTFHESQSMLAEVFYLQSGINFIRRGNNFEEIFDNGTTIMIREGSIHAWYAQIPILACIHLEMPIRQAGHTIGFFMGPAVGIGLTGVYNERKVSPYVSSLESNYDLRIHGTAKDRDPFSHLNRLDVSAILGLSYEYRDFTITAYLDHGFLATSTGIDVLRVLENAQNSANNSNAREINVKIPNGTNVAYMLSVAYRIGSLRNK